MKNRIEFFAELKKEGIDRPIEDSIKDTIGRLRFYTEELNRVGGFLGKALPGEDISKLIIEPEFADFAEIAYTTCTANSIIQYILPLLPMKRKMKEVKRTLDTEELLGNNSLDEAIEIFNKRRRDMFRLYGGASKIKNAYNNDSKRDILITGEMRKANDAITSLELTKDELYLFPRYFRCQQYINGVRHAHLKELKKNNHK